VKRFLIVCLVLLLPVSAAAFNVPMAIEVISSQTIGASSTVTSTAQDISAWSSTDGYFSLVFKIWGSTTADAKIEILCYDIIDADYTLDPTTSDGDGTVTSKGELVTSTETSFSGTTDATNHVEFDMPLCTKFKIRFTELDAEEESVNAWIVAQ